MSNSHDSAPNEGGSACNDKGDGTCRGCGVAMVECFECHGIGYHFNGCVDGDEDINHPARPFAAAVHEAIADLDLDQRIEVLEMALASVKRAMGAS